MTVTSMLHEIWSTVTGTVGYLLVYRGALVLAILAAAVTRWIASMPGTSRIGATLAGTAFAGLTSPSAKADLASVVRAMQLRRGTSLPFLIATHVLTPYHLVLLGPLLGKDALLSVVLGGVIGAAVGTVLGRAPCLFAKTGVWSAQHAAEPITALRAVAREIARNGPSIAYGLLAGGAIAAWGLSPWAVAPATLCGGRMAAQLLNAAIGVAVAVLLNSSPAAMRFIGTFLWKVGLAHAGLVAFFCAAPMTPTRLLRFHRDFGKRAAITVALSLALAAVAAGVISALVYRLAGLSIHYKLIPEQML